MYPDAFEPCDGFGSPVKGVRVGQQPRKAFGFAWQTGVGNDQDPKAGYIIHVVWNATAKPSSKDHASMNDSPDAETFSWECDTMPVELEGYEPVCSMEFDSTVLTKAQMKAIEDLLYGTESVDPALPDPDDLIAAIKAANG